MVQIATSEAEMWAANILSWWPRCGPVWGRGGSWIEPSGAGGLIHHDYCFVFYYLPFPQYQQKGGKQNTGKQKRVGSSYALCNDINTPTHSLAVNSLNSDLLFSHVGLNGHCTGLFQLMSGATDSYICVQARSSSGYIFMAAVCVRVFKDFSFKDIPQTIFQQLPSIITTIDLVLADRGTAHWQKGNALAKSSWGYVCC